MSTNIDIKKNAESIHDFDDIQRLAADLLQRDAQRLFATIIQLMW